MSRRRSSSPQQTNHNTGSGGGSRLKDIFSVFMPKKILHSVSETAKCHANVANSKAKKDTQIDFTARGLTNGCLLFQQHKQPELLERVILDNNCFTNLPEELSRCLQLRVLSLAGNDLSSVPHWIASLISLVELDLRKNNIHELPESFKCLKKLNILQLSFNPLCSIDQSIMHCPNLTELYINDCSLQFLPATIGRLHHLNVLEARNNGLQSLPVGLCRLSRLMVLDVACNRLTCLPETFSQLVNLNVFFADDNHIVQLPNLDGLNALEFLDVSNNMLSEIPFTIERLSRLEALIVSGNRVTYLPASLGNLSNLQLLRVDKNCLKFLPAAFERLNLKELSAVGNELVELPESFCRLGNLETLFLDGNRLQTLPAKFGELRNLQVLSLRNNCIKTLPDTMGDLRRLVAVDLRDNQLDFLPFSFRQISTLKAVWLNHNQVIPKISLVSNRNAALGRATLTCYLLPQQNSSDTRPEKQRRSDRKQTKSRRITFDNLTMDDQQKNGDFSKRELRRCPTPGATRKYFSDASSAGGGDVVVRTETSFGAVVREAKVVHSNKVSPRLLYQLDKMKNQEKRSVMFRSSALTVLRNDFESASSQNLNQMDTNKTRRLPVPLIRPYAMIDLKTLQAQVEAERYRSACSRDMQQNERTSSHEYEAIFDFKKSAGGPGKAVREKEATFGNCVQKKSEMNEYVDLNRSF